MSESIQQNLKRVVQAFLLDDDSESIIKDSIPLSLAATTHYSGGVHAAVEVMAKNPSPDILIIDISDAETKGNIISALQSLANVVEPDTLVLAFGDSSDLEFYRQITKGMGVAEYISKPLTREAVVRYFLPVIGESPIRSDDQGGRITCITGARGGVGASSLAVALARHAAEKGNRHTIFIDAALYGSAASVYLHANVNSGLREVLEHPDRIDSLFVERMAEIVTDRLHLLAGEDSQSRPLKPISGAPTKLIEALKLRYNHIIVDLPNHRQEFYEEFLETAHHHLIVLDPTIVSLKEAHKIVTTSPTNQYNYRPSVVLNKVGLKGGLSVEHIKEIGKLKIDVEVPDISHLVVKANDLGTPVSNSSYDTAVSAIAKEVGIVISTDTKKNESKRSIFKIFK